MTRMSITVDDSIYNALENLSDKTGIEKSILIEMSLTGQKSLEDIEIEYLIESIKDEETISYEEVKAELGWK
jgi:predicted transcriptional regulator